MHEPHMFFAILNLGPGEIILVVLVILLLFGAKRLPELARGMGQGIREFKGAMDDAKKEIEDAGKPSASGESTEQKENKSTPDEEKSADSGANTETTSTKSGE